MFVLPPAERSTHVLDAVVGFGRRAQLVGEGPRP